MTRLLISEKDSNNAGNVNRNPTFAGPIPRFWGNSVCLPGRGGHMGLRLQKRDAMIGRSSDGYAHTTLGNPLVRRQDLQIARVFVRINSHDAAGNPFMMAVSSTGLRQRSERKFSCGTSRLIPYWLKGSSPVSV